MRKIDRISVRLDPFTATQLNSICSDTDVSISDLVRGILSRVADIITDDKRNIDKYEFATFFGQRLRE